MALSTIASLKALPPESRVSSALHVQFVGLAERMGKDQRPFFEAKLADASGELMFRVWSDSAEYLKLRDLETGIFISVEAEFFQHPKFGLDAKHWQVSVLDEDARAALLLAGPLAEKQSSDFASIEALVDSMQETRLATVCRLFLEEHGERFRRTGAARVFHHARRGGLVEHVAQMMRDGEALCRSRPDLFRDLLLSGVLFHDSGKLWENCYDEAGFSMPYSEFGELLGHITIGVELVNSLWRKATEQPAFAESTNAQPSHDQLRMHLLHLIVSHHGELEFGSPVLPKTPEAVVLHYLDNIDAKLEMLAGAYATGNPLSARIVERVRPLNSNLVRPLRNATEMG